MGARRLHQLGPAQPAAQFRVLVGVLRSGAVGGAGSDLRRGEGGVPAADAGGARGAEPRGQASGRPGATVFALSLRVKQREPAATAGRSEEHTSELPSLMRISYAFFCLKKKKDT